MTISKFTMKFLGKKETMYRVIKNGEVVQVLCSEIEAAEWVSANA